MAEFVLAFIISSAALPRACVVAGETNTHPMNYVWFVKFFLLSLPIAETFLIALRQIAQK
jgi:hypothetical protein